MAQSASSLQRGKTPPRNEYPDYNTKNSDSKPPVRLELLGMWSTPLLKFLPGPLWPREEASDRAISMGQRERNCEPMQN